MPPTSEPTHAPTTEPTAVPSPVPGAEPDERADDRAHGAPDVDPHVAALAAPDDRPHPRAHVVSVRGTHGRPYHFTDVDADGRADVAAFFHTLPSSHSASTTARTTWPSTWSSDYKPVIQEITRAQSVSLGDVPVHRHAPGCPRGAPGGGTALLLQHPEGKWDNDTAVLIAVTNFYATDEIDRDDPSAASTVFEVGDNVTWRMNRAIFKSRNQHQATFNRKMKMRIRNSFGGSRTRKGQLSDAAQAHVRVAG